MPMKSPEHIPPDIKLYLEGDPQGKLTLLFRDADRLPVIELGGLDILNRPSKGPLYQAKNIEAGHGWGPFLLDVAMEWVGSTDRCAKKVTLFAEILLEIQDQMRCGRNLHCAAVSKDGGLYPDNVQVSPEAERVFHFYFDSGKRPDVERDLLSKENSDLLGLFHNEDALRCLYWKPKTDLIQGLERLDKWRDETTGVQSQGVVSRRHAVEGLGVD